MNPNAKRKDRFEDDVAVASPPAKQQKPATVMAGKAEPFPKDIPMENDYGRSKYYVRECYAEYYDVVMDLLRTKDGVTLTGTPGIGTSLCMAYFFQRYSREHPDATIIMASYSMRSALRKVVVARGQLTLKVGYDEAAMENALLDGIPKTIPIGNVRWVSFSTPDESWMKQLAKNPGACAKVYMPVWTLEELRDAALVLNRLELLEPADDDELLNIGVDPAYLDPTVQRPTALDLRFAIFNGVARWCFINRVRPSLGSLRGELYGLERDGVQSATVATVVRAPSVLHFVPSTRTPRLATIRVASTTVQQYFTAREQSIVESKPTAFEQSVLRGVPEM